MNRVDKVEMGKRSPGHLGSYNNAEDQCIGEKRFEKFNEPVPQDDIIAAYPLSLQSAK